MELTKVNTYGLLYVWPGQDTSLKPILLAAHQGFRVHYIPTTDLTCLSKMLSLLNRQLGIRGRTLRFRVISMVTSTAYPRCELMCSNVKGKRIWGRGSSDDKSGLIGILFVRMPVSIKTQLIIMIGRRLSSSLSANLFRLERLCLPLALTKRSAGHR